MASDSKSTRDAKRRGGLRAVSATLPKVTAKVFGKRGLAEAGLVADWAGVVGSELAAVTLPRGLRFPSREARRDGTLTLRVAPGHGPAVQHLAPLIVERINAYMGYGAVARLTLQQGPVATGRTAPRPAAPAPTREEREALRALTAGVEDEELRAALERLAHAVRSTGGSAGRS